MSESVAPRLVAPTAEQLAEIEGALVRAWTGAESTPFLADAPLDAGMRALAEQAVRTVRMTTLLRRYPALGVWGVLTPLARNYSSDRDVYSHIDAFTREDFQGTSARNELKVEYVRAARRLGLPIARSNDPSDLFFPPLGPIDAYHGDLAAALVSAALRLGPPAIEDTPSARLWQRLAVRSHCGHIPRLCATVDFDQSAWLATRFEAWRRGEPALGPGEEHLFAAYAAETADSGHQKSDIVGPPRLFWTGYTLAFEPEATSKSQNLRLGPVPTPIAGGRRAVFAPPWSETVAWSCGGVVRQVPAGPGPAEVLVFEQASGALLARLGPETHQMETHQRGAHRPGVRHLEVPAERHVVMARRPFEASLSGPALQASDPSCFMAWTVAGDRLVFEDGSEIELVRPVEAALWIDAPVLGRALSRPLYAADGQLKLRIEPGVGGSERVIRARAGDAVHYVKVEVDADGFSAVPFASLGLADAGDPVRVLFEVLAPRAAGDMSARAELTAAGWVWPGVDAAAGAGDTLPVPTNFLAARSRGLRRNGDTLHVDLRADTPAPILGLRDPDADTVREYRLAVRGERLWHVRVGAGDQVLVPRQARLVFGHANRHDTLVVRSDDRDADLVVLGQTIRRPFFARSRYQVGAALLEGEPATAQDGTAGGSTDGSADGTVSDDRIALKRKDGQLDLLARLIRIEDPAQVLLEEEAGGLCLSLLPRIRCDALKVRIETAGGEVREGAEGLFHLPTDRRLPPGVAVDFDPETGRISVRIGHNATGGVPGRAVLLARAADGAFQPLADTDGAAFAVGLEGRLPAPDIDVLLRLAGFLAEPAPGALGGQLERVIGPHYAAAFAAVGAARMLTPVKSVVGLARADGGVPRHDLVGVAPWLFEAPPFAFGGLSAASGLAPLASMRLAGAPAEAPDPRGDRPLADWLDRLVRDPEPAGGLEANALGQAFRMLRHRLRHSELRLLLVGPDAAAASLITAAHVEALEALRAFDVDGGGDDRAARMVATLERFARAAAMEEAGSFLDGLGLRTGLAPRECGRVLTLMLRAGVEAFAYFRILWHHARQARDLLS